MTQLTNRVLVNVRYFAAARAAAGSDGEALSVEPDATIADLIEILSRRDPKLATVLSRCSYLCDGVAVRNHEMPLRTGHIIDVLPPFAGG